MQTNYSILKHKATTHHAWKSAKIAKSWEKQRSLITIHLVYSFLRISVTPITDAVGHLTILDF